MKRTISTGTAELARGAVTVASLLLVAGCASFDGITPPLFRVNGANELESSEALKRIAISPANWPAENWWERYGDPQLHRLVTEALADHPSLRVAEARVRQAAAQAGIAEATVKPQVVANLKDTRQRFSEHSIVPPPLAGTWNTVGEATLNFSLELDFWGRNQAAVAAALDRVHATEVDAQAARLVLTSGVVQTYFRLAQAHERLDLARLVLQQREELLRLTRQRVAAGIDSEVELNQAESAVPAARQAVAAWQETIAITCNQLAALLGTGPDRGAAFARPQLAIDQAAGLPSAVPADLVGRRPDVVAQRWRVEAASREIDVARAQFYPNVSLLAFVGLQSLGLDRFLNAGSHVAGIGPAVSLPIFDGRRLRSNLGARNADYDAAVEQYNQTLVDALQDVVNQLTSIRWLAEQHGEQLLAVRAAQTAYDLALQRYRAGLGTYLQVLIVEAQVHAQKSLLIDLDARALQLDASLIRALGGGVLGA
jgi:NodT family efflux transporter outer membrane factor (OMF) lipoprotein